MISNYAAKKNLLRWSGKIRDWVHVKVIFLNPDKQIIETTTYVATTSLKYTGTLSRS